MFGTSKEHLGSILKEKILSKVLNGKVVFVSKVYDLITINVDLLVNSSNQRSNVSRIFEEHSTNVYFKNVPRISLEYCKVTKTILEVKKFKRDCFLGYPVKILILAVSSLEIFF